MNTVLLVEPRRIEYIPELLKQYQDVLGDMNYVFFCGKSSLQYWKKKLKKINLYPLPVDNMNSNEYNDFMKRRDLWTYLTGKYVLTIQCDTWINPDKNNHHHLDYFIKLNKSYIGGNFLYDWKELKREGINPVFKNFNGGLSLRNRLDMIKVIDHFPPQPTLKNSQKIETDAEDVYFTLGCMKLGLEVGLEVFAIHDTEYKEGIFDHFFGIHSPSSRIFPYLRQIKNIHTFFYIEKELNTIAIFNGFPFHYEMFGYVMDYCMIHKINLHIYTRTENHANWFEFYKQFPFTLFPLSSYQPDNSYHKVILLTDDDPLFDKEYNKDNIIIIDHFHLNRREDLKTHIGTRYFPSRPDLDWILPVYRQIDIKHKKKIAKDNIVFLGVSARDMINSEYVKNIKSLEPEVTCIFIDRYINNLNTEEMMNILKISKYVFVSPCNKEHIDNKMSASIPLALNFLCTLIIPKKMNDIYKLKSAIAYDESYQIEYIHQPEKVNQDLSDLLKHRDNMFKKYIS
jgi:hypothetical protein